MKHKTEVKLEANIGHSNAAPNKLSSSAQISAIEKAPLCPGWSQQKRVTENNNRNVFEISNRDPNCGPPKLLSKYDDPNYRPNLSQDRSLQTSCAASTESESTEHVLQDLLAVGELSSMFGAPGIGKGQLTCAFAARVTQGEAQLYGPDSIPTVPGIVLFISTEDDFKRVIRPRCDAAGANLDLIHSVDGICGNVNDTTPFVYSAESEKSIIAWAERKGAEGKGRVRLIVFDPGLIALGGAASTNTNVQYAFDRLVKLAKRLKCAILVVLHDTKFAKGKPPLDRAVGNRAIVGVPRCVMLVSEIVGAASEFGGTRVLVRAKTNIGELDGGYEFGFETVIVPGKNGPIRASKVVFKRCMPESPTDILDWAEGGNAGTGKVDMLDAAINFFKEILKNGPVWSKEVERQAKAAGITTRERDAAKIKLGVDKFKEKGTRYGRTFWFLPGNGPK